MYVKVQLIILLNFDLTVNVAFSLDALELHTTVFLSVFILYVAYIAFHSFLSVFVCRVIMVSAKS